MDKRKSFSEKLAKLNLKHLERAIAYLWYYRQTAEFEERSASEIANDLHEDDFPKPNITRLKEELKKSKYTVRGKQKNTFQLDIRKVSELDQKYNSYLRLNRYQPSDSLLSSSLVTGTRKYLEDIIRQINSSYELGLYDCCAVMCRRLMESLIIEIYIQDSRKSEIQRNGVFLMLDDLIKYMCSDNKVTLSRNTPNIMKQIKEIGDFAAHDRTYITDLNDIDDVKLKYRRLIRELLVLSKII
jgi:hypothetical protein